MKHHMRKLFFLFLLFAATLHAQQQQASYSNPVGGNLLASTTNCSVSQSCVWQKLPSTATTTTVTLTVPSAFSGTVIIETSADGGVTFSAASSQTGAAVVTLATTSLTDIRVRCSAYTSGAIAANIQSSGNQQNITITAGGGAAGGGVSLPSSIPGQPGLTAVPVTSGLMAEYRMLPGETAAGLLDYSGNGRNANGTVGTAPTVLANTGGITCTGNGAIILPTSVNGAIDIFLFVGFQTNFNIPGSGAVQSYQAPLMSNVAAATGPGLTFTNYQMDLHVAAPVNRYVSQIQPAAAAGVGSRFTFPTINGRGLVEWDMDTADHIFVNGQEGQYFGGTGNSSAGIITPPAAWQLCGAATGFGLTVPSYMTGQVYYAAFYNRILNTSERAQVSNYILTTMANRGVPAVNSLTAAGNGDKVYFEGDSIMQAFGGFNPVSQFIVLNGSWTMINYGAPGFQAAQSNAAGLAMNQAYFNKQARDLLVVEEATNDLCGGGFTAAQTFGNTDGIFTQLVPFGGHGIVATAISRTGGGCDTAISSYNQLLRQNWTTIVGAVGLVDMAADTNYSPDGAHFGSATYYTDSIHPTQTGHYNDFGPIYQRAINRVFGNLDFSSATTYVAAATAAVATTAGSEVTNTVTLTFGATPANCQVGNQILVAGTTPAGYSSTRGWQILTRSATQVTYWADTASMGAISVQGTGVCPQQQDADVYQILNFGAGNYTLESCIGYTSQNLYIKNVNAGASTIVPFSAETIDGAANLAMPTLARLMAQRI